MSNKPDSTQEHCERANERLKRAVNLLDQTDEMRKSVARLRVSSDVPLTAEVEGAIVPQPMRRTPSVVLTRDSKGVLRVKK